MSPRRDELALRREQLQQRSAMLRDETAHQAQVLGPALGAADRVRDALAWAQAHPALVAAAVAAWVVWRPRAVWRWGRRAWSAWRFVQRVRGQVFKPARTNPRGR